MDLSKDIEKFATVCNTDSIVRKVMLKHAKRCVLGKKKYGVTLDRKDLNLEQWLLNLQEELMDACCYIEKLFESINQKSQEESGVSVPSKEASNL